MKSTKNFIEFLTIKPFVLLYTLILTTLVMMLERYNPLPELLSGLITVTNSDYSGLLVSVTQLLTEASIIAPMILVMLVLAVLLSMAGALLFTGFFGTIADGAEQCGVFTAKKPTGFIWGYRKNFLPMLAVFAVMVIGFELLLPIWLVASVPYAIVAKAVEAGVMNQATLFTTATITFLILYLGATLLRVYTLACIPALYSPVKKPVKVGIKYAGKAFWSLLVYLLCVDFLQALMLIIYAIARENIVLFVVRCGLMAVSVVFILFVLFDKFGSVGMKPDGGYDEYGDEYDDDDDYEYDDEYDDEEYDDDEYDEDDDDDGDDEYDDYDDDDDEYDEYN